MSTLSVIIPAYNEEDGIGSVSERVLSAEAPLRESMTSRLGSSWKPIRRS
jgi:cellulose synthase/poly-beta-1,6-N-acetylglucosamine synthase-like glycosyltransferase